MNGFNQIPDEKTLFGCELLQVCIGRNEIILNFFPDKSSILIHDSTEFFKDNSFLFDAIDSNNPRIRQIGKTVERFVIFSNEEAHLLMSDGSEIILKDDSSEFESITIYDKGRIFVI